MSDHPLHQLDPQATDSENANPSGRFRKRDIIHNAFGFSKSKTKEVKKKDSIMLPGSRPTSRQSTRSSSGISSASSYSSGGYHATSPTVQEQEENRSPPLNVSRALEDIFPENLQKPTIKTELPHLQQRIERTAQLVYCNTLLLQDSPPPPTSETGKEAVVYFVDTPQGPPLDKVELDWLDVTKKDPMEADRLRWLANRMVEKFVADINNDSANVGEIVSLGSVLAKEPYRKLLSTLIKEFEDTPILNVDILQGLVQLLQAAPSGYLISDDLIKILSIIRSTEYSYHLTLAVSRILDVMADHKVQDLDRVLEHEPLSAVLSGLKGSSDPYLMYQACYAFQALQYVPDDETALHAVLRHSTDVANGLAKTFGVLKLDLSSVLDGLASMYRALESTIEVANSTYEGVCSLRESGRGVLDSLKEGLGSGQRRPWYPAVKAAYAFAQAGQLKDLKQLLVEAPCRRDTFFQWGICQLLGEIAVDPVWDISARQQSVSLLGHHLYKQDQGWGCDESVRSWILTIITNFANTTDQAVGTIAKTLLQELEQDQSASLQYRYPLSTQLRIPATSPLLAKMQDIPYLEYELHKFRLQRLEEANLPVYIPPMAKANLQASDDDLVPLMDKVQEFLSSDRQVMLILGDSGAGKSTFNKHLEVELLTAYKHGGHIPLFINLPTIDRPDKDLVTEHLRTNNFSEEQIKELKLYRRLVLICDGYDESQLTVNLHTTNHFNRSGQWHIKMVISCRTQFLGQEYRSRFMPEANSHYNRQAVDLFQEAVIAPFSKEQIKDYVEQYVPLEPRTWTTMDYMDRLTTIPNLMDLVRNPFLLSLSLEALPGVTEGKQDLSVIKITRVQLYDTFVTHWLDVNSRRLLRNALSKEDREILDQLLEAGFTLMGIDFSTRLASAIFEHQDGNPVVQYVHLKDRRSWRVEFFGPDPEVRLLRESSPLTRTGSQFRFLHRSMLEYFLSCAVFDPCDHRDNGQLSSHSDSGTAAALSLDTEGPLFKRNLLSEPSVIQFLCERVKQYPEFETQLLAIVEQSKSDSTTAIAAANAITILVRAGVRFNSANLRGIRIPGADLSDSQFDSALLQGADLTGVNFSGCWLRDANFSNTLMAGAQYGELPYLKEEVDHIDSCAYSSNGRMMAVGLRRGDIEMYDTTIWTKIHGLGRRKQDVWNMAFSPNDQHIVSRSDYSFLRLWDISSGKTLHLMQGHTKRVVSMVFSPCGKQIASSSHDKTVRLWSSETGKEMLVLEGHTDDVNVVKYAPDGRRLVSGSDDGTVRFWDPKTGNAGPMDGESLQDIVMELYASGMSTLGTL
ncbi:hypothetical protein BGZ97_009366 [Linnemannia gamsii]|uniref:WD40 repeat-like protein n=1 Tax=Linnemannia gamsii TaxID=64522 RepID=A0A9P6R8S3_9FUNG|nr:hypothetical protein BGZ97_009366 [Linnemannia gamsii]